MYLVSYDISNPKRLRYVAKTLNRYGLRVHKSVFECDIDECRYKKMRDKLTKLLKDNDSILCYHLPQRTDKEKLGAVAVPSVTGGVPSPVAQGTGEDELNALLPF